MPTKVFDALDVISSIHVSAGNITYNTPTNGAFIDVDMADMISLPAPLSFDVSFSLDAQGTTVSVGVQGVVQHVWDPSAHINTVMIDYQKPITGIPDGAMIKSMVIRSPWNCNLNLSYTKSAGNYQAGSTKRMTIRRTINIPGFFIEQRQFGMASTPGQSLQLVDEELNADADVEIFNFTDPLDYIPLSQFITQYSQIILRIDQSTANDLHTFQLLSGSAALDTITGSLIYLVSFHTGWTITIEYEEVGVQFEVTDPPADRSVGPGDTITVESDPLDPDPLDPEQILTLDLILLDKDGNTVGTVNIPELLWIDIEPNLFRFILPEFSNINVQWVIYSITSTQFTGSVALQQAFAIYFYNAPGVYTLVAGRTHDTYYDRQDPAEIATVDTKIPDPTGRTGYY